MQSTAFPVWRLQVTTNVLCYGAPEMRKDKICAMISPCQVADYWSLHFLDFHWLKLYGSSADFDWLPKSSNPADWPLPMDYRWTIRSGNRTDRIIRLVSMYLYTRSDGSVGSAQRTPPWLNSRLVSFSSELDNNIHKRGLIATVTYSSHRLTDAYT